MSLPRVRREGESLLGAGRPGGVQIAPSPSAGGYISVAAPNDYLHVASKQHGPCRNNSAVTLRVICSRVCGRYRVKSW
jgi:hypothetical protein